jgi:7,8-dihydropterin-6-yl-methyl-4-(beta-D-ribofuranosyl)aminobenzene 5'-phosphate synthase
VRAVTDFGVQARPMGVGECEEDNPPKPCAWEGLLRRIPPQNKEGPGITGFAHGASLSSLIKLSFLVLLIGLVSYDHAFGNPIFPESEGSQGRLTILYDNNAYDYRLKSSWGFSCLIELGGKTILFDTGGDGEILLNNMRVLNKDPKTIDMIVLSHIHGDHTGGLWNLLREKPTLKVYIPGSFPEEFEQRVKTYGTGVVRVDAPLEIGRGIHTTGEMGHGIKEQSLLIHTSQGMILITGCAHPGIVNILEKAKTIARKNIDMVIGGWHLSSAGEREINGIIEAFLRMGVQKVAPCHCTGDRALAMFKNAYGENFIKAGAGSIIKF